MRRLTALILVLSAGCGPALGQVVAIKAGKIITASSPSISNGVILVRNGKIAAVGANVAIPQDAKVIDASGKVVMPGLVAALTHLGDRTDIDASVTPDVRAVDAFDFYGDYKRLLEGGITTGYVATGGRRLVSGQGAVVKLAGASPASRTVRSSADVRITLGDLSKGAPALFRPPIPPTTENPILPAQRQLGAVRPSEFAVLRQLFADARGHNVTELANRPGRPVRMMVKVTSGGEWRGRDVYVQIKSSSKKLTMLPGNAKLAAISPVLSQQRPLRIVAHTASDILKALAFADDQHIKIVLEGATEAYKVAPEIARRNVPVVLESAVRIGRPMTDDLTRPSANGRARLDAAAILARAGVRVSLAPGDDADLPDLLLLAAYQVQAGVSRESALKMVCANGADALGLGSRIGAISVGRDADLVVLSGDPLDSRSMVEMTVVDGAVAYKRPVTAAGGGAVAIRAGRILTATQGEIQNGVIVVRGGKIESISRDGIVPAGMTVIDATHSVVTPGMIDAHSHIGLHADAEPSPLNPPAATSGTASGRTKLMNAVQPNDPAFAHALQGGVTAVLLTLPTAGQVCGQATLLKTIPGKDRMVKELAALCFNEEGGAPRMSQIWNFRELMQRAKDYLQRRGKYEQDRKNWERDVKEAEAQKKLPPAEPAEVPKDEDQEPFAALFRKEIPALVHANRTDEISNALTVFCDESSLNVVLMDVADGYHSAETIQKHNTAAAVSPTITRRDKGAVVNNADQLSRAGVRVLFQSNATSSAELLRMNAAYAVRNGMDPADALRALTINPARALNVQDRLGSIEPGKDADFVILSGDPFEVTSRVERVFVNGKEAYHVR